MSQPDIIVFGGSAGSIPCLMAALRGLPRGLPAVVFVVNHLRGRQKSQLAEVLSRAGGLPVNASATPSFLVSFKRANRAGSRYRLDFPNHLRALGVWKRPIQFAGPRTTFLVRRSAAELLRQSDEK